MIIDETIVRAVADGHSLSELEALRAEALRQLGEGSVIVSASSGGGTSYSREVTMRPDEAVRLYQAAIELKNMVVTSVRAEIFVDRRF